MKLRSVVIERAASVGRLFTVFSVILFLLPHLQTERHLW